MKQKEFAHSPTLHGVTTHHSYICAETLGEKKLSDACYIIMKRRKNMKHLGFPPCRYT